MSDIKTIQGAVHDLVEFGVGCRERRSSSCPHFRAIASVAKSSPSEIEKLRRENKNLKAKLKAQVKTAGKTAQEATEALLTSLCMQHVHHHLPFAALCCTATVLGRLLSLFGPKTCGGSGAKACVS